MKEIIYSLLCVIVICGSCMESKPKESLENFSDSVLVLHNYRDTSVHEYYKEIIESPDFEHWRYNRENPDTSKIIGSAVFHHRVLKIKSKIYYEFDLWFYDATTMMMSTIPNGHVCTFRIDLITKKLFLLNNESEKYIDFRTDRGRKLFQFCLNKEYT